MWSIVQTLCTIYLTSVGTVHVCHADHVAQSLSVMLVG